MRIAPAILLLATAGTCFGQDKNVTLQLGAARVENLLPQISKALGVQLLDTVQTRDEVLVIKVKDVPGSKLLEKIALTVNGTWQKEGNALRLVRTQSQQSAEAQEERTYQIEQIKTAMKASADRIANAKPWTQDSAENLAGRMASVIKTFNPNNRSGAFYQQFERLSREMPAGRAVDQVMLGLDPAELAAIPPQIKVVYSTSPTPSQRKLNPRVWGAIDAFVRDLVIWQQAKEKKGVKPPTFNGMTYYFGGMDPQESTVTSRPAKALVAVSRYGPEMGFQVELLLADEKGKIVSRNSSNLITFDESVLKEVPPAAGEPTLTLTGADLELVQAFRGQEVPTLSDALRQRLLRPEDHEPLAMLNNGMFFQIADAKKKNLVVSLPDRSLMSALVSDKPVPLSQYLRRMEATDMKLDESDDWFVSYPRRRLTARQSRVDRKTLGDYLRRVAVNRKMNLEERARFALTLPSQSTNYLPWQLERLVSANANVDYFDERILRLYGTLTPEQIRTAKANGLPFSSLKESQIGIVRQLIYAMHSDLQLDQSPGRTHDPNRWNNFYNSLEREPTESLPNGLPSNGLLKLVENIESVAATPARQRSQYTEPPRYLTAQEFAWQSFSQSRPDLFPWMDTEDQKLNLDELRFGSRRLLNFTFQLTDELVVRTSLQQNDLVEGKPGPLSGLPEDYRKQVQAQVENFKKSYENTKPGHFGPARGTNIPPAD